MYALLFVAALVTGLGPRPSGLTGGRPTAYAEWLHARVLFADRAFGAAPCAEAELRSVAGRILRGDEIAPAAAAGRARATNVFFERVRLTGCGRSMTHNLQVVRRRGGGWDAVAVLPGDALSSPRRQTEAMQTLAAVIVNGAPALPCRSTEALRTMTHGEARVLTGPTAAGTWRERWPIRACGVDRTVEVTFAPPGPARVQPAWSR